MTEGDRAVTPGDWVEFLQSRESDELFREIYGDRPGLISERKGSFRRLVEHFAAVFGEDRELILARSPCRINLMGMHVEHRGGFVNYVTHSKEIIAAAARNGGDKVDMVDIRSGSFPRRGFEIGEEIGLGDFSDWVKYIESPRVVERVGENQGDWSNYVKAGVLRLQNRFSDTPLHGMDMAFLGNIPTSSGLSSSSAMVVVSSLAAIEVNGLSVEESELVNLCGEGEWYVGTRGGAGDHAAMLFCRRESICHLRFFPFEVTEYLPFPPGHDIVIANSMKSAHKAGEVLDAYNQTIAAYNMVLMMIKSAMADMGFSRDIIEGTRHLRDVNPERIPLVDIYRIIGSLPDRATRDYLRQKFEGMTEGIEHIFRTHREPGRGYRIRSVALFGVAECERGRRFADILGAGDVEELGRLMLIEHDGDRVVQNEGGLERPWINDLGDDRVRRLIEDSSSDDPRRLARARLHYQPGGYGCSSPELDEMVDIARSVPGVLGAGLTGAGFGGCIRILVRSESTAALIDALKSRYYDPRGLPSAAEVIQTVARAGVLGRE